MKKIFVWTAIERFGTSGISLLGNIIFARMLAPEDFGLVGLAAIYGAISSTIIDSGMSDGIIRKIEVNERDYNSVFVFNFTMAVCLSLFAFFGAPFFASVFSEPRLIPIIKVYSIGLVFGSISLVPLTRMRKQLQQMKVSVSSIIAISLSLIISIFVVKEGYGYWGLILNQVLFPFFLMMGVLFVGNWYPRFSLDVKILKEHVRFGLPLFIAYSINQIGRNLASFFIGKNLPLQQLGLYTQANKFSDTASGCIDGTLNGASFIIISSEKSAEERKERISNSFSRIVVISSLVMGLSIVCAPALFEILFGNKWSGAVPIFQGLCVINIFTINNSFLLTIYKIMGDSSKVTYVMIIEKIILLVALLYASKINIVMMILVMILVAVLFLVINLLILNRSYQLPVFDLIKKTVIVILLTSLSVVLSFFLIRIVENNYLQMIIGVVVFLISFFALDNIFRLRILNIVKNWT